MDAKQQNTTATKRTDGTYDLDGMYKEFSTYYDQTWKLIHGTLQTTEQYVKIRRDTLQQRLEQGKPTASEKDAIDAELTQLYTSTAKMAQPQLEDILDKVVSETHTYLGTVKHTTDVERAHVEPLIITQYCKERFSDGQMQSVVKRYLEDSLGIEHSYRVNLDNKLKSNAESWKQWWYHTTSPILPFVTICTLGVGPLLLYANDVWDCKNDAAVDRDQKRHALVSYTQDALRLLEKKA